MATNKVTTKVEITAEDKATQKVKELDERLDKLTSEDREAVLKARADDLEKTVKDSLKKLAQVDGEEFAAVVAVKDQASAELKQIRSKLDDLKPVEVPVEVVDESSSVIDKIKGKLEGLTGGFGDIGGKLGKSMAGGFAAIGVGALMAKALESSWDRAAGLRNITAKFRLSSEEMAEYGETAGDVYAENWGESLTQVQDVVATTAQRLSDATGDALQEISTQVLAASEIWGEDYEAILRSITQLTQNELADSSQEALDLIVTGFQDGLNEAGDLLDTIDEYSQHFGALGFSGEDAFNMLADGMANGQRDTDKLADAVKEFRLRAVEDIEATSDAYRELGLDADDLREQIANGGDGAREAFLEIVEAIKDVEDPVDRNRLAIQFLGTQIEDLGPTALNSLTTVEGALRDVEGAAADAAATVGDVSPWERSKRVGERALTGLGIAVDRQLAQPLDDAARGAEYLGDKIADLGEDAPKLTGVGDVIDGLSESFVVATEEANRGEGAADRYAESLDQMGESAATAAEENEEAAEALKASRERADEASEAIQRLDGSWSTLRGNIQGANTWLDLQDQFDEVEVSAKDAYDAAESGAEDAAEKTRDAERDVNDLKIAVGDYAKEVLNLPDEVVSKLIADIDAGKKAEVEAFLARLGDGITLPIKPYVIPGTTVRVDENGNVRSTGGGSTPPSADSFGSPVRGTDGFDDGGPTGLQGAFVPTRPSSGSGGVTINVSGVLVGSKAELGRVVQEALSEWQRRGGR